MATQRWDIDTGHSSVQFSVRHMVISKVRGRFTRWSATLETDGDDLATAQITANIDITSIDTGVADRDNHLRSADFFDADNHPEMIFKSTRVERLGEGRLKLVGDLTIRGTTLETELDVEHSGEVKDPWGNLRVGFTAKGSVDRKAFGLTWNQALEAGGVLVGDRVDIEIEVEAVKQAASQAA